MACCWSKEELLFLYLPSLFPSHTSGPCSVIHGSWPHSPVHSLAVSLAPIRQFCESVQFVNLAEKRVFFFLAGWHVERDF